MQSETHCRRLKRSDELALCVRSRERVRTIPQLERAFSRTLGDSIGLGDRMNSRCTVWETHPFAPSFQRALCAAQKHNPLVANRNPPPRFWQGAVGVATP